MWFMSWREHLVRVQVTHHRMLLTREMRVGDAVDDVASTWRVSDRGGLCIKRWYRGLMIGANP